MLSHSIPSYEVQSNSLPICLLHPVTLRYLVVPTHEPEFTATNQPYQSSLPLFVSSSIQARPSFHQPPPPPASAANPPNTLHSGSTTCAFFASSVMTSLLIKTPSLFFKIQFKTDHLGPIHSTESPLPLSSSFDSHMLICMMNGIHNTRGFQREVVLHLRENESVATSRNIFCQG